LWGNISKADGEAKAAADANADICVYICIYIHIHRERERIPDYGSEFQRRLPRPRLQQRRRPLKKPLRR